MSQVPPQVSADGRFYWDGQAWKPMPAPHSDSVNRIPGLVVLAGAAAIVLGPFLPWLTASAPFVGTITRSLMDDGGSDGPFLLIIGGIILIIGGAMAVQGPVTWAGAIQILLLVLVAAVVIFDYNDVHNRVTNATSASNLIIASVGPGPYVAGFGIVTAAIGSAMAFLGRSTVPSTTHPVTGQSQAPMGSVGIGEANRLDEATRPEEAGTKLGMRSADGAWYWNGEQWLRNA